MCPIRELYLVVVLLNLLGGCSFIPREREVLTLSFKVVLYVALRTNQRAHLLVAGLGYILSHPSERLDKRRSGNGEVHRIWIMTVGATNWVHNFASPCCPFRLIELFDSNGVHQPGNIRTFTGPACAGLRSIL